MARSSSYTGSMHPLPPAPARSLLPLFLATVALGCTGPTGSGSTSGDADSGGQATGGETGGSGGDDTGGGPVDGASLLPDWDEADFAVVHDVGPDHALAEPGEVPWESLGPGTLVRIHGRDTPYAAKWVISTAASEAAPLVVLGVGDPVITGVDATTRQELDYWNEDRSVIKVGESSSSPDTPSWVVIQGLTIEGGHPDHGFTDDRGEAGSYRDNAACVHLEAGSQLFVQGNTLRGCGNGLFAAGVEEVRVLANDIGGNGVSGSYLQHNTYTEALGIHYLGNRMGPLAEGAEGNNLKDRSAGTVVESNWIEGGNRALDLVDSGDSALIEDPRYGVTQVLGNVLIELEDGLNSQVLHYGGDSGDTSRYRGGTLYFHHNTVLSERAGNTTVLRLSSEGEAADLRNNVVQSTGALAILAETGSATLRTNLLPAGWSESFDGGFGGSVSDAGDNVLSDDAGLDAEQRPEASSLARDLAGALAAEAAPVTREYGEDGVLAERAEALDAGAFEGP